MVREQTATPVSITGLARALPPTMRQDELWRDFFARHYAGSRLAEAVFARSGVRTRHATADPRDEDLSTWPTGARMRRFVEEALPLGKEALAAALADAGLTAADVGLLAAVSCTGYATPGLDILLARDLGLRADAQRLAIGHMGCYAALPGLAAVADAAAARSTRTALLCLELTSLHIQPASTDRDQIVAHALFSDGAAAVIVEPDAAGLRVLGVTSRTDPVHAGLMTWDVTDLGFRMGLSPRVPQVLGQHVADAVGGLLAAHDLAPADVAGWAVHPGGPRILDVVAERLALDDADLDPSRGVLADHGNCSSATVLLILERLRGRLGSGDHVVALAFGPGLTLYAALLQQT